MAFVRKKRVHNYEYYELVENRWVNGQPRQRVLVHLGRYPTAEAALQQWPGAIQRLGRFARKSASAPATNLKKLRALRNQGKV